MKARRNWALIAGFLCIGGCYGLEVLEIRQPVIDIKPYLAINDDYSQVPGGNQMQLVERPLKSKATFGTVHPSQAPSYINTSIVILGDDECSRRWIMEHPAFLAQFQGIGLVANAEHSARIRELETLSGIPLVSMNVDALMTLLDQSHYPLVIEGGKVWQ